MDTDTDSKWYSTEVDSPRFTDDITKLLQETHKNDAHLYALEKMLNAEEHGRAEEVRVWKSVLTKLDKEQK